MPQHQQPAPTEGKVHGSLHEENFSKKRDLLLENRVFCAIINDAQLLETCNTSHLLQIMPDTFRNVLVHVVQLKERGIVADVGQVFEALPDKATQEYVSGLLVVHDEKLPVKEFERLITLLDRQKWRQSVQELRNKINQAYASGNIEHAQRLLHEFATLKRATLHITPIKKDVGYKGAQGQTFESGTNEKEHDGKK